MYAAIKMSNFIFSDDHSHLVLSFDNIISKMIKK